MISNAGILRNHPICTSQRRKLCANISSGRGYDESLKINFCVLMNGL